jgi:hypothetical protein
VRRDTPRGSEAHGARGGIRGARRTRWNPSQSRGARPDGEAGAGDARRRLAPDRDGRRPESSDLERGGAVAGALGERGGERAAPGRRAVGGAGRRRPSQARGCDAGGGGRACGGRGGVVIGRWSTERLREEKVGEADACDWGERGAGGADTRSGQKHRFGRDTFHFVFR